MYRFVKRSFCVVASLLGIIVTLPIWLIAIIGIMISDFGPIFYVARRVGKNNRVFRMYKFRSMRVDKKANEISFKADTNRIFPFGAFMRASKIDELPQLLNCFLGDMAIIGPRPASIDQISIVRAGEYAQVSSVTPGLSGPSALYDYIYGDTVEDETEYEKLVLPTRLALDLYYVKNGVNLGYDLKMIWWTVKCILNSLFHRSSDKMLEALRGFALNIKDKNEETVQL